MVRKRWILAACGLLLATGVAYFAYVARTPSPYTSSTLLFVTQRGYGFSSAGSTQGADGAQLITNAYLYAQFAQGDQIRRAIGAQPDSIFATVVTSGFGGSGSPLPFIELTAKAKTADGAKALALASTRALQQYVAAGQAAAQTPAPQRSRLQILNAPSPAERVATRTRVAIMPAIVFLAVILVTLGAIFALENLSHATAAAGSRQWFASRADVDARLRARGSIGESEIVHSGAPEGSFRRRS